MTRTQNTDSTVLLATPLLLTLLLVGARCAPGESGELQPFPPIALSGEAQEPDCRPLSPERVTFGWAVSKTGGDEPAEVESVELTVQVDGADLLQVRSVIPRRRGATTSVASHGTFPGTTATLEIIKDGPGRVRDRFTLTSCRNVLHQFSLLAPEPGSPAFVRSVR